MTTAQKPFMFDLDFEELREAEERKAAKAAAEAAAQAAIEEVVVPTFSQEELDAARLAGYEEGRASGFQEATEATERMAAEAVSQIAQRIGELFVTQSTAAEEANQDAIAVALAVTRKVLPSLEERHGLEEIQHVITESVDRIREEAKVVVKVAEMLEAPVREHVETLLAGHGHEGRILVIGDGGMPPGDCRLEWSDGGAERDTVSLWREIDEIIERSFGGGTRDIATPPAEEPAEPTPADPGGDQGEAPA